MPIEPPFPVEVLDLLRAALVRLQREQLVHPHNASIGAVATDVSAAIAKMEVFSRASERSQA